MQRASDVLVVGAGVFGLAAALELRASGRSVAVLDAGPIPHPLAASNDVSKAVRPDYGSDDFYVDLMLEALPGWRAWNARWARPLYHETGVAFLSATPLAAGGFEQDCASRLEARGVPVQRFDDEGLATRFPQWAAGRFAGGYVNPWGGWAEAGAVVTALAADAERAGVALLPGTPTLEVGADGRSVRTPTGWLSADHVIVAAGVWTPKLVPELAPLMWASAHDIFLLRPPNTARWAAPRHLMFGADIANTGWYGFPITADGLLKIAHHGHGARMDPDAPRTPSADLADRFAAFVSMYLPGLTGVPLVETRVCLYCDTFDSDFWIDRHPTRPGLVVASGGSGHGFKFAPVTGPIVRAVIDDEPHPARGRFGWRGLGAERTEDARADN